MSPFLLIDRDLHDAVQLILDRVLDRDDLVFVVPDLVEGGVKRRRFTRTRRARHEHHAVRLLDVEPEPRHIVGVETDDIEVEILETLVDLLFVEDTDDRVFAKDRRHDRNTKVDRAALVPHTKTSVLRDAALGDVELGHDLDTRDQRLVKRDVDRIDLRIKRTVDTEFDLHIAVAASRYEYRRNAIPSRCRGSCRRA